MAIRTRPYLPHAFAEDPASEWEEKLFSVFNGALDMARVGRIPHMLAKAIGSRTTIVMLSKTTAKKIRGKHKDIRFAELKELATAFHEANVAREGKLHLAFWYQSPLNSRITIKAVIKATRDGREVYLKTIHPIAKHRLKALKAKTMVLRER